MTPAASASSAARSAASHPALKAGARVGIAVNGVLHLLIGGIAIGVAAGGKGRADQSGALQQLGSAPFGAVVLWIVTLGLAALGLFFLLSAIVGAGEKALERVKSAGKGVAYLAVGAAALRFALGSGGNSAQQTRTLSGDLLALPIGVVLLVLLGLVVAAIGVSLIVKGARRRFLEDIRRRSRAVVVLGMAGYLGKGIAVVVVGILFVVAALTNDPNRAGGLDGALQALVALPAGQIILAAVAAGILAYGLYCFLWARSARL